MTEWTSSVPSGMAEWERRQAGAGFKPPLSVMLLPDAMTDGIYFALLSTPMLWRSAVGEPVFSLTLVLERQPTPSEEDITPLIRSGVLAFEVTLAVPQAARTELVNHAGEEIRPIFARNGQFRLIAERGGSDTVIASAQSSGPSLRVAFSAMLTQAETLDVLSSLDGQPSRLRLQGEISFRAGARYVSLRLQGSWAGVHDFLKARSDANGELGVAELQAAFNDMLSTQVIAVVGLTPSGTEEPATAPDPAALFQGFMRTSAVILERRSPQLATADQPSRYKLKARPHPSFTFSYTQSWSAASMRTLALDSGLEEIIGGALDGVAREQFLHIVCLPTGNGSGTMSAPRRVRSAGGSRGMPSERTQLGLLDGEVKSISLAMRPSTAALSPAALMTSDVIRPRPGNSASNEDVPNQWWLDDVVLERPISIRPRPLPVVDDPSKPIWRDRIDAERYWYAPAFELLRPAGNAVPDTSPFLFIYQRVGVTGEGKPALTGTVRFTLQKRMSDATRAALQALGYVGEAADRGNAHRSALPRTARFEIKPAEIPMTNLSVSLAIPYIDERDGKLKSNVLQGKVSQVNDIITVSVSLLNDSVRLCYGALAVPGFQREPARLQVAYTFEAYAPIRETQLQLVAGGKISRTPIAHSKEAAKAFAHQPHFDATTTTYRDQAGEVRLNREASLGDSIPPPQTAPLVQQRAFTTNIASVPPSVARAATSSASINAAPLVVTPMLPTTVIARPPIRPSGELAELLQKSRQATRTLVRQEQVAALYPCEQLGALYRQTSDMGSEAVGCVDALKLGQTVLRNYAEMPELAHPLYRVFRALQQPGRFLILPAAYRITRYAPSVPDKAYRPAIAVYSSIDLTNPGNNRVIYHATLQPDIPLHLRRGLQSRLAAEARDPVFEYPTEIAAEAEYAWNVGSGIRVEPKVVKMPDSFQVTLATDLAGALLLRSMVQTSGVLGSARFTLSDGTKLECLLAVELVSITGPWSSGPVEVALESGRARLTNRIERPVDVSDLMVYTGGLTRAIEVEATLAAGASHVVSLPAGSSEVYPVYTIPPGTPAVLEEIRSFVEDIQTNVVFIDLVNYANHGLTKLEIRAQIKSVPGTSDVAMQGDPPRGSLEFLLPLTTYLANHILQFQVKKTFAAKPPQTTRWLEWDLESNGNVVSLTWELIQ